MGEEVQQEEEEEAVLKDDDVELGRLFGVSCFLGREEEQSG